MNFECLTSDSPNSDIAERVYELRQRIYVFEMGYPPTIVRDEYDERSRLLLLRLDGEDVGTARLDIW